MKNIEKLASDIVNAADVLDQMGLHEEAGLLDGVLEKVAQGAQPSAAVAVDPNQVAAQLQQEFAAAIQAGKITPDQIKGVAEEAAKSVKPAMVPPMAAKGSISEGVDKVAQWDSNAPLFSTTPESRAAVTEGMSRNQFAEVYNWAKSKIKKMLGL